MIFKKEFEAYRRSKGYKSQTIEVYQYELIKQKKSKLSRMKREYIEGLIGYKNRRNNAAN